MLKPSGMPTLVARAAVRSQRRSASTSASPATSPTASTSSPMLDWETYLKLRRSKRRYGLLASIPSTVLGFSLGMSYFATIEAEPTDLIMGVEPIYAYGAATMACGGLGWLAGPVMGSQVWRLTHRRFLAAMEQKDKDFYKHIVKNRVDPSRQSVSNPVPDYYCEKPGNLRQYRQWLRDQSAYNRKAQFGDGKDAAR